MPDYTDAQIAEHFGIPTSTVQHLALDFEHDPAFTDIDIAPDFEHDAAACMALVQAIMSRVGSVTLYAKAGRKVFAVTRSRQGDNTGFAETSVPSAVRALACAIMEKEGAEHAEDKNFLRQSDTGFAITNWVGSTDISNAEKEES